LVPPGPNCISGTVVTVFELRFRMSYWESIKGQEGRDINGAHELLVYADLNLLDQNTSNIKENKVTLLDTRAMWLLYKYITGMFVYCHHNARQNHYTRVANISSENIS
jgi:hypothetical protein